MDGFDVCAGLRRAGVRTPIILLTARVQEAEKILGLDARADEYVTKPFGLGLRARIRAQLRRALPEAAGVYRFGDCEIDFDRAELKPRSGRRGRFGGAGGFACQPALDHGQHSAERAKPAETGLPSIYAAIRPVCFEPRR